jgi:hypothetical protein
MCFWVFLSNCSQKKEKDIFSDNIKELNGNVLIPEDFLQDPWTISVMDSFLFVGNMQGVPMIEAYNRFSKEQVNSFLTLGQGPLEILALSKFQTVNDRLLISDLHSKKILSVNKSNIGKDSVIVEPFFTLSGYDENIVASIEKMTYLNDTYNIVYTNDSKGRLGLLDKRNKTLSHFYPFTEAELLFPELDASRNNRLFSCDMTVNTANNRVALSTHMADMLDVYEYTDDKLRPVWHHHGFLPNGVKVIAFEDSPLQAFYTNKSVFGYHDIASSSKNVYALFVGRSAEEGDIYFTDRVRVFDWNGKNRFEIKTNYPLKRIAVTPDDKTLYGISKDEDGQLIIVYFDLIDLIMRNSFIFLVPGIGLALAQALLSCSVDVNPPEPYGAVPTEHQLKWQQMEYYVFVHFGPNTFIDVEWGNGKEDPYVFNPSDMDCRQWAATAKAAGMKGIIITAKHHDGFCLWPSQYSTHTVRESSWREGKGDVLKELSDACREYGLAFGVYLSPWDQNHPSYGSLEYNQVFANTLTEVLTGYGPVFEQWFDGANGEAHKGERQIYDWDLFHNTVYTHQPQAVIFSDVGPGYRWMGNERGVAGETNWSRLDIEGFEPGLGAPPADTLAAGNIYGRAWVPAETDVSICRGWFYSPNTDDKIKSVSKLMDIYHTSIGRIEALRG